MRRETYWPLLRGFYTPQTSPAAKIKNSFRGGRKIIDCQPSKHSDEDHMVPIVAASGVVNGVYCAGMGAYLQVLKLAVVFERVDDL